jgi:hypothetical protein
VVVSHIFLLLAGNTTGWPLAGRVCRRGIFIENGATCLLLRKQFLEEKSSRTPGRCCDRRECNIGRILKSHAPSGSSSERWGVASNIDYHLGLMQALRSFTLDSRQRSYSYSQRLGLENYLASVGNEV